MRELGEGSIEVKYRFRQHLLARQQGDVTGDGNVDLVSLVGTLPDDGSGFITNITLVVEDGATGQITSVPLTDNAGFNPSVFLCDFTGDGVEDIKITIQSGGSGGFTFTYVYSFVGGQPQLLFRHDLYMESKEFRAFYADGFVVVVEDLTLGLTFRIDVSQNPAAQELYDEQGNLLQPTEANVGPFLIAYPIVLDEEEGTCSLQALTRVYGQFAADTLGYIQDYLSWDGTRFATVREELAVFGTESE